MRDGQSERHGDRGIDRVSPRVEDRQAHLRGGRRYGREGGILDDDLGRAAERQRENNQKEDLLHACFFAFRALWRSYTIFSPSSVSSGA